MKKLYYVPLTLFSIFSLFPFYIILMMSTRGTEEIFKGTVLIPGDKLITNLNTIIQGGFHLFYINSLYTSFLSGILSIIVSAFAGYALAKFNFRLKKLIKTFILVMMMIPSQISLIGYVIEMRNLGLVSTHLPIILIWGSCPYGVFFMMQYINTSVPYEVMESARIDGCNELMIFLKIIIAFIKPAIATLFILVFLWSWNNYLLQVTVLNTKELFTIPVGIKTLSNAYTQDWGARATGLTMSVIPMLIIFAIGSKSFITGLSVGAIKG